MLLCLQNIDQVTNPTSVDRKANENSDSSHRMLQEMENNMTLEKGFAFVINNYKVS